jgi:hypothetical protein
MSKTQVSTLLGALRANLDNLREVLKKEPLSPAAIDQVAETITLTRKAIDELTPVAGDGTNTTDFFKPVPMPDGSIILVVDVGGFSGRSRVFDLFAYRDGKTYGSSVEIALHQVADFWENDFNAVALAFWQRITNDEKGSLSTDDIFTEIANLLKYGVHFKTKRP